MKLIKPLGLCALFAAGVATGWLFKPDTTGPSVQISAVTHTSAASGANTPQHSNITAVSSNNTYGTPNAQSGDANTNDGIIIDEYLNLGFQSGYRNQLNALTFIDQASEATLIQLVRDIENNSRRFHETSWLYRAAVQRWAEANPQSLMDHFEQIANKGAAYNVDRQIEIVKALAVSNNNDVMQWVHDRGLLKGDSSHLSEQVIYSISETNPLAAIELVQQSNGSSHHKLQSIENVLAQWSYREPLQVLDWIDQNPELIKHNRAKESAMVALMEKNPEAGLSLLPSVTNPQLKSHLEGLYAAHLAHESPERGLLWANSLTNDKSRQRAEQRVLETWSFNDPDGALAYVASLPVDHLNKNMLFEFYNSAAYAKSTSDPIMAMAWVDTVPQQVQEATRNMVFNNWIEQSPTDAVQWLQYSTDDQTKSMLIQSVAPMLASMNLDLAMQLYPEFEREAQTQMAYGIVSELYYADPSAAQNWVDALPDSESKTDAATTLIVLSAEHYPQEALNRALSLPGEQRTNVLQQVAYTVTYSQAVDLPSWMNSVQLTDDERQMLNLIVSEYDQNDYYQNQYSH